MLSFAVLVLPNIHAHLSAFSLPLLSYHAVTRGSEATSASSCAKMLMDASMPGLPLGEETLEAGKGKEVGARGEKEEVEVSHNM